MKHVWTVLLALGFVCSLAFYFWIWMPEALGFPWPQLTSYLRPTFHAVPAFCLQLFLLRVTRNRLVRAIPLLLLTIPLSFALFYIVRNQTWDRLGALIFLFGSVAPAVGCALGWGIYGLCRRKSD